MSKKTIAHNLIFEWNVLNAKQSLSEIPDLDTTLKKHKVEHELLKVVV